jgi:hypothetical protein
MRVVNGRVYTTSTQLCAHHVGVNEEYVLHLVHVNDATMPTMHECQSLTELAIYLVRWTPIRSHKSTPWGMRNPMKWAFVEKPSLVRMHPSIPAKSKNTCDGSHGLAKEWCVQWQTSMAGAMDRVLLWAHNEKDQLLLPVHSDWCRLYRGTHRHELRRACTTSTTVRAARRKDNGQACACSRGYQ